MASLRSRTRLTMSGRAVGTLRARRGAARRDATAAKPSSSDADDASTRSPDDAGVRRRRETTTPTRRRFFRTLARVARLARPYFYGDSRWRARGLLFAVVTLCGLTTWLMVVFSDCQKDMSTALAEKDAAAFYAATRRYVAVVAVAAPLFATYAFAQNTLALEWRVWLTRALMERYFRGEVFYRLERGRSGSARESTRAKELGGSEGPAALRAIHPEQALCEDARRFTETCATLLTTAAQKLLSLCAFLRVLYSISPVLVATCFAYSACGALLASRRFAGRLTDADAACSRAEADLRSSLLRVRDHAESVAFCRGGAREFRNALVRLRAVCAAARASVAASRDARLFANAFEFATFAVPSLAIAPSYFRGDVAFGAVTQAGFAFRTVSAALNVVVGRFEELTALAAETERLEALEAALLFWSDADGSFSAAKPSAGERRAITSTDSTGSTDPDDSTDAADVVLRLANVSAAVPRAPFFFVRDETKTGVPHGALDARRRAPRRRALWSGLDLVARRGDAVLVAGPSGCGKSALFRVIAGLWDPQPTDEAPWLLAAPPRARTMFLPQETYAPGGDATLRDLVTYPGKPSLRDDFSYVVDGVETRFDDDYDDDDDVRDALRAAGLRRLLFLDEASREPVRLSGEAPSSCLDVRRDWSAELSPGERQRVAFARVALRRPSLAFLDEATSFLDERAEREMYALARRRAGCVVSVGHRSSLVRFHDTRLDFVPGHRIVGEEGEEEDAFDAPGTWETSACRA